MEDETAPPTPARLQDLEDGAEAAYAAMYDAPSYEVKDLKDDACRLLAQAAAAADALGLADEAARLRARAEHVRAVYDSQFRYVGR